MENAVLPILIIAVFFGFLALAILLSVFSNRRYRKDLINLAGREGFSFSEKAEGVVEALADFPLLKLGHSRTASLWLSRGEGAAAEWLFQFRYVVGSGKHRSVHRQTVFVFPYLEANFPAFELCPENFLHRIGQIFGYQDIDLTESPRFSSMFLLRGKDVESIRALFDSKLTAALETRPKVRVEGGGSCLLLYESNRVIQPDRIVDVLGQYATLRDVFLESSQPLG